jgi:hypothetical protein
MEARGIHGKRREINIEVWWKKKTNRKQTTLKI